MSIGQELRIRRLLQGVKQWLVARLAELTSSRLSDIELEKRVPTDDEAKRIQAVIDTLAGRAHGG